jgi:hypothetical protein
MQLTLREKVPEESLRIPGTSLSSYQDRQAELTVYGHIGELVPKLAELPLEDIVFPEATLEDTFMRFYGEDTKR